MIYPAVFNTSEICFSFGVRYAVLSPGSRNAPLILSFARNTKIKKFIIPDERSAGFMALGIAQITQTPVVLCCTSGTAVLNYAPAVAEAYYRNIPLLILSADRPPHLIDQRDGQTIRQHKILKNITKVSIEMPLVNNLISNDLYYNKLTSALSGAISGPIHINFPFDEPLYPADNQRLKYYSNLPNTKSTPLQPNEYNLQYISKLRRIIILIGQNPPYTKSELNILRKFSSQFPILAYPLSNFPLDNITHFDGFIKNQKSLQPDLLITTGLSVVSKNLKKFLRQHQPQHHLHLDPLEIPVDTYQTNPKILAHSLPDFLTQYGYLLQPNNLYFSEWKKFNKEAQAVLEKNIEKVAFADLSVFYQIWKALPADYHVHLGNSMPVRYAEMMPQKMKNTFWSNRGCSGIDGTTSTALGSALATPLQKHVLITGDVAFFYDRNAFFHPYPYPNLKIIILNNRGGGIFRLLEGPAQLNELEKYFETRHNYTAENLCREYQLQYFSVHNFDELENSLHDFFNIQTPSCIMEIFTHPETNPKEYHRFRSLFDVFKS